MCRRGGGPKTRPATFRFLDIQFVPYVLDERLIMQITNSMIHSILAAAGSMVVAIFVCGCSDKAAVPSSLSAALTAAPATYEIVGFYGAADDGGTFVRTMKRAPVKTGDRILVTGTGLYDGNWSVLQTFQYQDPMDLQPLWGYRIEPKWEGYPPGFTNDGGVPPSNAAKVQPLPAG